MECHCCKGFEYCSFEKNGVFHLQIRGKTHDIYLKFPLEIGIIYYPRFICVASFSKEWREPGGQFGEGYPYKSPPFGGFPNQPRSKSLRWWLVAFPMDPMNNKQTCYSMVDIITKQHLDIHLKVILDPCWWTEHLDIYPLAWDGLHCGLLTFTVAISLPYM